PESIPSSFAVDREHGRGCERCCRGGPEIDACSRLPDRKRTEGWRALPRPGGLQVARKAGAFDLRRRQAFAVKDANVARLCQAQVEKGAAGARGVRSIRSR